MKLNIDDYTVTTKEEKVKGKFINRELSWLDFNGRVLHCANNPNIPLNERFKFLAISCSNLDEFISVRYGDALQKEIGPLKEILNKIIECMDYQLFTYENLKKDLIKHDVVICGFDDLNKKEEAKVKEIFRDHIKPLLSPINLEATVSDIPVYNGQTGVATIAQVGRVQKLLVILVPKGIDTIYEIDNKVIMIEDIIIRYLNEFFINVPIESYGCFRIIKNNSMTLNKDDEGRKLIESMKDFLDKRDDSGTLFLEVNKGISEDLKKLLMLVFNVRKKNVFDKSELLDYTRFMNNKLLSEDHDYEPFEPAVYQIDNERNDIFKDIRENEILLHHPYDSYETVVDFIEQASLDPKVALIRQTLYRVSSEDSPIVDALCRAARRGKVVVALVEVKARFDEKRNISLIEKLTKSKVTVMAGMPNLKTHCKMCLISRKDSNKKTRIYAHVGTGNYNENTARLYTDLSYFTCNKKTCEDLSDIFNILAGGSRPNTNLSKVFYSPINIRDRLEKNIKREIENAKKGKKAEIFIKVNSINDPRMINNLYKAAKKGVDVYIVCRGITSIVSTDHLFVKSIVGRFLEHSRIYYFSNNGDPEYYISSADFLTRNLDKRVEALLHIEDPLSIKKLDKIIDAYKKDEANSFIMDYNGKYCKIKEGGFDCHQWFIDNPSSGVKLGKIKSRKKK